MTRSRIAACCLLVVFASGVGAVATAHAAGEPGVLMGAEQKAHWDEGTAECPNSELRYCADEISQSQFVGWPFIAEHTGTVEAIFAALATGEATGAEVGIFANRKYKYAEIEYRGEEEDGAKETWTPAMFKKYEAEIPPEDPGALLGASGKVGESKIVNNGWTEFKLQTPVKVVKGEKYWLTNTAFQEDYGHGAQEFHKYQLFYHEQVSSPDHQPWGNYTNEPKNWEQVARTLKELPDPEETRIDCEKCDTEGLAAGGTEGLRPAEHQPRRPGRRRPDLQLRLRRDRRRRPRRAGGPGDRSDRDAGDARGHGQPQRRRTERLQLRIRAHQQLWVNRPLYPAARQR